MQGKLPRAGAAAPFLMPAKNEQPHLKSQNVWQAAAGIDIRCHAANMLAGTCMLRCSVHLPPAPTANRSKYAKEKIPYGIERYSNETRRLLGVLEQRLEGRDFIMGGMWAVADCAPANMPACMMCCCHNSCGNVHGHAMMSA